MKIKYKRYPEFLMMSQVDQVTGFKHIITIRNEDAKQFLKAVKKSMKSKKQ
jgi:hypothetical protein